MRQIRVIYGPHGAPEYFTENYIGTFFATQWEVHFNSSRTGVRLIGPKPEWVRADGGEAGLHPSNIHDNPYAIGAVDFTGDMPVILGPDGPSLGGFVCPVTVIEADLWQLGQLKAGDKVQFLPVDLKTARNLALKWNTPLWERACSRRGRDQTPLMCLTHRFASKPAPTGGCVACCAGHWPGRYATGCEAVGGYSPSAGNRRPRTRPGPALPRPRPHASPGKPNTCTA